MLKAKTINIVFLTILVVMVAINFAIDFSGWWYAVLGIIPEYSGMGLLCCRLNSLCRDVHGRSQFKRDCYHFDDGPIPVMTEKILDVLNTHKVPAAFFCIGNRVHDYPALIKRMHEAGHLIGNHSYWHGAMFDLQSPDKIAKELADTDVAIQKAINKKPNFFRPPFGVTNPMVASAVKRRGYKTIGWTVRSFDTMTKNGNALLDRVTNSLKGGDVILFHYYSTAALEMLPAFLDQVALLGLKIVRVDELLKEKHR